MRHLNLNAVQTDKQHANSSATQHQQLEAQTANTTWTLGVGFSHVHNVKAVFRTEEVLQLGIIEVVEKGRLLGVAGRGKDVVADPAPGLLQGCGEEARVVAPLLLRGQLHLAARLELEHL